jgi:hypothetical protein
VDESAESVASVDLDGRPRADEARAPPWYPCCQLERSVRPVSVVVVDVDAQDALKLSSPCDQEPVEAVAADGADKALGGRVRVRRSKQGQDDLDTLAAEDVVEGAGIVGELRKLGIDVSATLVRNVLGNAGIPPGAAA